MAQCTILMVDDNEVERLVFRRILARHLPECRLVTAENGAEALRLTEREAPHCAVIDLVMPGMDGIDLCRRLKEQGANARFPILLITAQETDSALRARGLEAGADDFLQRPGEAADLVAKLRVMLRIKQAEDELRTVNRRLAELAEDRSKDLRFRDQQFHMMFNFASDAVFACDSSPNHPRSPRICDVNDAACRMTGMGRALLLERTFDTLFSAGCMIGARVERLAKNRSDYFEATLLRGDGQALPVAVHAGLFDADLECRALFMCRPQQEYPAPAQKGGLGIGYSLLAVETGQILYDHTLAQDQVVWDGALEQVTGRPLAAFQGQSMRRWREGVLPDERLQLEAKTRTALESLGRYQAEYRIRHASGELRHVEEVGVVVPGEDGTARRVLGTIKDITGRIEAERERRRQDLEAMHSKRLESLGVLAGGIAHDFNNLLTGIIGLTDLSLAHMDPQEENYADLTEALQAAHRAKELVRQILAFSRQSTEEKSPIHLQLVARECLNLLRGSLPSDVEIVDSIAADSGAVLANATQMHQVIMNCCTNAIQAMAAGGGKLEVRVENVEIDADRRRTHPQLRIGPYVKLSIVDQGLGMEPEVLTRAFDPFYSTKGPSMGTGMGLAAVHGIVTEHKGVVRAESAPGRGTTISVYLPRVQPEAAPARGDAYQPTDGSARILLVDNDPAVLRFAEKALRRAGYEVTSYESGAAALQHFKNTPDAFDLVLTDQGMPKMSGTDLTHALKAVRAEVPVVLFTGFQEPLSDAWLRESGVARVLRKPLLAAELAWTVSDVLAEAGQRI